MATNYTLEDIDAEIARREAARNAAGAVPASGMVAAEARPQALAVDTPAAPPESPRRSMWDSMGDTASGLGRSLGTGVQEAVYGAPLAVNKLLGLHGFETTKRLFVDPLEQRLQAVREREAADTAGAGLGEQVARATARGVGNLATLPLDIAAGGVVKAGAALARGAEVVPKVATSAGEMLNAIPSFALGAGVRKTGEEESITGLPKGIAEGIAMEKVGEIGKNMAMAPKLVTQTAAQGGLGAAMTTADTVASEGRLPTKEELAIAAGSNAAMALPFSAAPERMSVKRDMPPEFRKQFETTISDLIKKDQISALPDENLSQLRDTAGKLAEYDPENKTFMTGLLEIDREQQRRDGVEPQPMELGKPAETPPAAGPLPSRTELAGLAMGDLNSQDRLMEIADSYGIKEPHKMEPGALLDAIDTAETGRQAEAQRQTDAAQAVADMQAQADQARQDIVGATTEADRLDAIARFEDVTKKLAQAPALPAGQGFDLVPYEGRRDVQAGRVMLEEQRAALGETPALPPGQGFELVGGPKPMTQAEAAAIEAAGRPAYDANAITEPIPSEPDSPVMVQPETAGPISPAEQRQPAVLDAGQAAAPEQRQDSTTPPVGTPSDPFSGMVGWKADNLRALSGVAEKTGAADKIEALAAQGLTARQIADSTGLDQDMVLATRIARGIPSLGNVNGVEVEGGRAAFDAWKKAYDERRSPDAGLQSLKESTGGAPDVISLAHSGQVVKTEALDVDGVKVINYSGDKDKPHWVALEKSLGSDIYTPSSTFAASPAGAVEEYRKQVGAPAAPRYPDERVVGFKNGVTLLVSGDSKIIELKDGSRLYERVGNDGRLSHEMEGSLSQLENLGLSSGKDELLSVDQSKIRSVFESILGGNPAKMDPAESRADGETMYRQGDQTGSLEAQPINSDGTPTDGVFYDRSPKAQAPAEFARIYGIPETPEFLDAIRTYQDITGEGRQDAPAMQPAATDGAPLESRQADAQPVAPEASPEPAQPILAAPLGKDGQPLFETITAAPFKPGGFADAALPQPARKLGQPDMVPLSSQSANADMGGQGQAQGDAAASVDGLTPLRVELPEMVRMTRDLIAKNPMVKERLSKAEARGLFRAKPDNPGIELASHIFIGPMLAEVRTKAPAVEARAALTDALAQAHGIPANEIQVKATKDGAWTKLRAFRSDPEHAGQVLAHEIGHLVDFLPDQTMARGNILGRLASLKKNIKTMIEDMPADAPGVGAVPAEGPRSGLIGNNEIRAELKALTQFWKPFDLAADPEYTRYRHSGPELYADAFSVLLNAPAELKARAPKFYDAFQNYLIQKPEVRETYQGIQNAMHSGQVFKDRVQATREGFAKADEMRGGMYADERTFGQKVGETGRWAKRAFVDQYAPVREVLTGEDASYAINRAIYSGSEKELYVTEMHQRVSQRLQDAGLTPDDLGEYLLHLRVINERGQMANPHGWTPKASLERLEEMRSSTYSPDQLAALEGAEKDFRDIRANLVTDKMDASGMFAPELMQHIREATDYATFDVVKYIDDSYGTGIGSKIHKQIGTFEAVGSPYTATLKKDLSMLSSINWNNAKKAVVDDLLANRPDQITPAEMRFNGKSMSPVEKTTDKVGTIFMMRGGKVEGYHVDRLVAEAFNRERPEDLQILGRTLSAMSSPFRTIFTTIRPGFQAFNTIKDLRALYRNLPGDLTAGKTIRNYLKALPDAWAAEFGLTPEIVKQMQRDDMLISVADPMGLARIDQEHDRLMKMYNLEPGQYKNTVWKPFMNLYGQTLKMGGFLERIPKIAAYRYLKENFPEMSQDQIGEFIRTKAGSPAFLYKGSLSPITNNLFLFSNAIVQGMRGDFGAMKADPKNWWSKWAMGTMAPKMIGRMALYGAFGAGVKTIMDGISDYDLSNYDVIPLGLDANGKSVYLRLPVDEMGRMTGSLLWKGLNLMDGAGGPTRPADIFDMMAGQAPNVAPWASLIGGAVSFLSGHNPYDAFRGREVIDPTVFKAGGWEAQKKMLEWMWNSAGLGIVHRFDTHEVDPVKTDLQKVIGLPVLNDFLGRFVRVSDQGIREKLRAAGDVESSKRAQQVLDARSALAKMINGEPLTEADNAALAREGKTLKQSYGRLLTKQQDEALASALQNAGSQLEKAAVYQEYDRIKGTRGNQ